MSKDYKKLYEESIERARDLHDNHAFGKPFIYETCEYIFPELRESEDDRIIKTLKEIVNWGCAKNISVENNVELKDCLAWLEKQGEKLHVDWNEKIKGLNKLETYILSLDPNRSLDAVKVDAKNIRFLVNDGQQPKTTPQWMIDFLDEYRRKIGCSMDYDEIRDIDGKILAIVNWMKGNPNIRQQLTPKFKIRDTIHKIGENTVFPLTIEKIEDGDYVCNNSHSFVNIRYQNDYELIEQKPSWSAEDEANMDAVWKACGQVYGTKYQSVLGDWLKSLKSNYLKQSEVKNETKNECPYYSEGYGCEISPLRQCDTCLTTNLYNHWKPSEQNIKDLEWCADLVKDKMGVGFHRLQVFIDELKKL